MNFTIQTILSELEIRNHIDILCRIIHALINKTLFTVYKVLRFTTQNLDPGNLRQF